MDPPLSLSEGPDGLIAAALRRERVPWPDTPAGDLEVAILEAARDHGVTALLASASGLEDWPERVRSTLSNARRIDAAAEIIRRQELLRLLAEFRAAGIPALLMKGAQLAYTHYQHPWLRPRLDTDLLVAPEDRSRADAVMRSLAYRPATHYAGELVTHQFQYQRSNQYGLTDAVDLHWRISNPHVFAHVFTFAELERDSVDILSLDTNARGLSDAHALLLACIHRVAHHDNSNRLIWLYDIHLLTGAMSAADREQVVELATVTRLRAVVTRGISTARARFATVAPDDWLNRLQSGSEDDEPTRAFLETNRTKVDVLLSDLRTLHGWRPKARLLREHLFPPVAYMRRTYRLRHSLFLPFAYVDRMVRGAGRWFRSQR